MEYICEYCGKIYDSPYKLAGHKIHCKNNPNHITFCNFNAHKN